MPFHCFTFSNPNIIAEVDQRELFMRYTDVPNDLSYHTIHASKSLLAEDAKIMDAWTPALKDRDGEDAAIVDEHMEIKNKEWEPVRAGAAPMEHPTQDFVTSSKVQKLITAEMQR